MSYITHQHFYIYMYDVFLLGIMLVYISVTLTWERVIEISFN